MRFKRALKIFVSTSSASGAIAISYFVILKILGVRKRILPRCSENPNHLLRILQLSKNETIRRSCVLQLHRLQNNLPEWHCAEIAQALSPSPLAQLALLEISCQTRSRILNEIKSVPFSDTSVAYLSLRLLLEELNDSTNNECLNFYTMLALKSPNVPVTNEQEVLWLENLGDYDADDYHRYPRMKQLLLLLRALYFNSRNASQRKLMAKKPVLQILLKIWRSIENASFKDSSKFLPLVSDAKCLILKILCNLAIDTNIQTAFIRLGWIHNLRNLKMNSQHLATQLLIEKLLVNLCSPCKEAFSLPEIEDIDIFNPGMSSYELQPSAIGQTEMRKVLGDAMYLLHSDELQRNSDATLDIVFIHGLRGGVSRTWRSKDVTALPEELHAYCGERTQCWPREWLPHDVQGRIRVLAVDYASFFTNWAMHCDEGEIFSSFIIAKSSELAKQLRAAGVGDRPIVWVTHSMGGLIVKQMLCYLYYRSSKDWLTLDFSVSNDLKLLQQTKAVVFYGTPHYGSPIASQLVQTPYRFFILPSKKLSEIVEGSPFLLNLQGRFHEVVKKRGIACLSLAETLKANFGLKVAAYMVPEKSADPGYGTFYRLKSSHLNLCKPETRESANYRILTDFINRMLTIPYK